ncbi:exodeoxyribonuclease VII, large subunit, partial [Chlamydia psittaci 84-8471/1]
FSNGSGT